MSNPVLQLGRANWGLCGAVLGDLTHSVCPTIRVCQIPTIAPYNPEGGGGGGGGGGAIH